MAKGRFKEGPWVIIHRYIGLTLGLWLFAVGISGAVMAYYREIDAFLNGELFAATTSPRHPDLDAMIRTINAAYPDRYILYLDRYFLSPDESYPFVLTEPLPTTAGELDLSSLGNDNDAASLEVFVDPSTAAIVGTRPYWTWIKLTRQFHRSLLLQGSGRQILGVLAILLFSTCVAGGILWWRSSRKRLRQALSFQLSAPTPRLIRDTHTVLGAYGLIVIGWLSFTAALMCYEMPLRHLANRVFGVEPSAPVSVPATTDLVSLNAARDVALAEYPNSDVVLIRMAKTPDSRLVFRLYPDDEPISIYTRQVYVHAGSGKIVGRFDPDRQPWTDSLFGVWLIWFHNGGMLGLAGKVLNIAAGLILASLFPTGIYIWWKKRASRVRRRPAPASNPARR